MNKFEELSFNVEALYHAINEDKKFFSSIHNFVQKLHDATTAKADMAKKEELKFFAQKIEDFFAEYRPSPSSDMPYFPPFETSRNDDTVREIYRLAIDLNNLSPEEFEKLKPARNNAVSKKEKGTMKSHCVFIGHGRSKLWARLQVFLKDELKLETVCYESEPRVGESIVPILEKMLTQATFAVFVLTAEDQMEEGQARARQNVIHEAGLFQGRLGFDKALLLVQKGLESFSNIDGLQYIPFSKENIEETFYQLQRTLKAKGIIST